MKKAELISRERARAKAYGYAYWILLFGIVGGILAAPHLRDLSPTLALFTGNSWLVLFIVGIGLITIFNRSKMTRCPRCRRAPQRSYRNRHRSLLPMWRNCGRRSTFTLGHYRAVRKGP